MFSSRACRAKKKHWRLFLVNHNSREFNQKSVFYKISKISKAIAVRELLLPSTLFSRVDFILHDSTDSSLCCFVQKTEFIFKYRKFRFTRSLYDKTPRPGTESGIKMYVVQ